MVHRRAKQQAHVRVGADGLLHTWQRSAMKSDRSMPVAGHHHIDLVVRTIKKSDVTCSMYDRSVSITKESFNMDGPMPRLMLRRQSVMACSMLGQIAPNALRCLILASEKYSGADR